MKILFNTGGLAGTNCYLLVDETTGQCVLFDAPDHTTDPILHEIKDKGWTLNGLWFTHGHFDHVADHARVTNAFPATPVLIHPLDEPKLQNPNSRFFPLPFTIPPGRASGYVHDGQILSVGNLTCRVIHTPGHSPGHVMYYFESEKTLIGGDLIICKAVGRYDLPDSDWQDLKTSVRKVMQLPPETTLLPGHGETSTLKDEWETNPYVRQILEQSI
jgi:glyoxylase-like metal-dependent hydrolase (beta-lactamase superfamily II)